jgi:hypothetical protein
MRLVLHSSQVLKNDYCQKKFFSILLKKYKNGIFFNPGEQSCMFQQNPLKEVAVA